MAAPDWLQTLDTKDAEFQKEVAPGVFAFGSFRPMGRIRAYSAAGLTPFAGRGSQSEFLLIGHAHIDAANKITKLEGFNGLEGERWVKQAHEKAIKAGLLAPGATATGKTALRGCPHTGIR
jgi:hypothetical protein